MALALPERTGSSSLPWGIQGPQTDHNIRCTKAHKARSSEEKEIITTLKNINLLYWKRSMSCLQLSSVLSDQYWEGHAKGKAEMEEATCSLQMRNFKNICKLPLNTQ